MGRTSHCEGEIEREKVREKSESEIGKKRATDDPEGPPMAEPIYSVVGGTNFSPSWFARW